MNDRAEFTAKDYAETLYDLLRHEIPNLDRRERSIWLIKKRLQASYDAGVEHMREREVYLLFSPYMLSSSLEGCCVICGHYCKSPREMQHNPDCRALGKEQP